MKARACFTPRRLVAALALALLVNGPPVSVRAADGTWLGNSGTWSNTVIWSGGVVANGVDAKANFTGVNITATRLITNDTPRSLGGINFTDATTASHNLAISGSAITLDVTTGAPQINVTNQVLFLSNVVAGTKGFIKGGAGTLILTGNNTGLVGSNVTVSAGFLRLSTTANALGGAGGPVILLGSSLSNSTATASLEAGNSISIANDIIVQAGPTNPGARTIYSAASTITPSWTGTITVNEDLRVLQDNPGGNLTVNGAGSTIAAGKTVSFLANESGSLTDNAPWSGGGSLTYSTTSTTPGGGAIAIGGQKTHTGGSQILGMNGNTNTPSTAAVTANSTGPAGSPTSGPFGAGVLTLGAGRLRATTSADITIANTVTLGGNPIFPTVATEKSLTFTGPATLTTNRTLTVDVGATVPGKFVEFQGAIGQSGGSHNLTKAGTGLLVLGGINTYSGNTTVSGGALQLSSGGTLDNSPVITLASNTLFDVTAKGGVFPVLPGQALNCNGATVLGGMTVSGSLSLSANGKVGDVTISDGATASLNGPGSATNLVVAAAATMNFNVGAGGLLTVTATDGVANDSEPGAIVINITDAFAPAAGTYTLIAYNGTLQGVSGFSAYQLGATPPGASYSLLDTPGAVQLVVAPVLTWTGLESGEWSINVLGGLKNWQLAGSPEDYADLQSVLFDDSATGTTVVDISVDDVVPGTVTFNNSLSNYVLQGSQAIAGTAQLLKRGTNNLMILNDNSYSGPTTISAGRLILGNGGTSGSIGGTSAITNNGALVINRGDTLNLYSPVSGTGTLTKLGAGTLTIFTASTYNGATTVSNGVLQLGAADVLPNGAGKTGVTVHGTLDLNGFSDTINGLGGSGLVDNTAPDPATLTVGGNNASSTFTGVIANTDGTLNLTKIGTGTLTLSNANTFTGTARINAGTLALGNLNTLGTVAGITLAGGATLQPNVSNTVINVPITLGTNGTTATITTPNAPATGGDIVPLGINSVIGGDGGLILNGVTPGNGYGRIVLGAQNTYAGPTRVNTSGNNANCFVVLNVNDALPPTTVLTLDGGPGSGSGRFVQLNLNGFNQTLAGLANVLNNPARQQTVANSSTTPGTLTINNASNHTYRGQLGNSVPNGNFSLVKNGAGTLTLSPATTATNGTTILNNFYTGGTVINAGTLLVNNTTGSGTGGGAVTVNGGTLGGTGLISGAVTVNPGGTFSPGASIGTLAISNNLSLAGTTFLEVNKTAGTRDQVVSVSNAVYGGVLIVSNLAGTLALGDSFAVFSAAASSGQFRSITPVPGPGLSWSFNPGTGVLSVVTEASILMTAFNRTPAGGLSVTGTGGVPFAVYNVVTATNMTIPLVSWTPVLTNAFDAGGNFTIAISNALTTPVRAQFFRMVTP